MPLIRWKKPGHTARLFHAQQSWGSQVQMSEHEIWQSDPDPTAICFAGAGFRKHHSPRCPNDARYFVQLQDRALEVKPLQMQVIGQKAVGARAVQHDKWLLL